MANPITIDSNAVVSDAQLSAALVPDARRDQYGKTYRLIRRTVEPVGLRWSHGAALKLYHMLREGEPLPQNLVSSFAQHVESELETGRVVASQQVLFAILSQGFVSINVWGRGNVLFTQTYTVEARGTDLSPEPLEKTGVACTWEHQIMAHESAAWQRYLASDLSTADKRIYLSTFLRGQLWGPD